MDSGANPLHDSEAAGQQQLTAKVRALAALVKLLDTPEPVTPTCGISKSKWVAGLQCHKRLFLQVHNPEIGNITDQHIKQEGTAVGLLARSLFPGGVLVEADTSRLADALQTTKDLINNPAIPAIFEAAFRHDGVLVRADILLRSPDNAGFHLIEVKSATKIKPHHIHDLSIQSYVLRGAGVHVKSSHLMHVNPDYVLDGDFDVTKFFLVEPIDPTRLLPRSAVSGILNVQYNMLAKPEAPNVEIGSFCKTPYRCEFFECCHPPLDADDVRSLPLSEDKIRMLLQNGVVTVSELPTNIHLRLYWHFTENDCSRINAARNAGKNGLAVADKLGNELSVLKLPVSYMDFETIAPAVPRFRGMKPYEPIPMQWSVHRQNEWRGFLTHTEFLAADTADPRIRFLESLYQATLDARSIVVYGSYENTQLSNLCRWFPSHATAIGSIQERLVDLLPIVRRNVYSPQFGGSYSIKNVLPVLVPGISYDDLGVQSGDQVAGVWEQLISPEVDEFERARLRSMLFEYCERDTLALAHIVDALIRLCERRLA
jgi:uncharacterized protein DUF2779